jgi:hypothetical protein
MGREATEQIAHGIPCADGALGCQPEEERIGERDELGVVGREHRIRPRTVEAFLKERGFEGVAVFGKRVADSSRRAGAGDDARREREAEGGEAEERKQQRFPPMPYLREREEQPGDCASTRGDQVRCAREDCKAQKNPSREGEGDASPVSRRDGPAQATDGGHHQRDREEVRQRQGGMR